MMLKKYNIDIGWFFPWQAPPPIHLSLLLYPTVTGCFYDTTSFYQEQHPKLIYSNILGAQHMAFDPRETLILKKELVEIKHS